MERVNELEHQLRVKRQEYKDLRNDYEILKQNIQENVKNKATLRKAIAILYKEYKGLGGGRQRKKKETPNTP